MDRIKLGNIYEDIHDRRIAGIDDVPLANSDNIVKSGGIKSAIDNYAKRFRVFVPDAITARIKTNKYLPVAFMRCRAGGSSSYLAEVLQSSLDDNATLKGKIQELLDTPFVYASNTLATGVNTLNGSADFSGGLRVIQENYTEFTGYVPTDASFQGVCFDFPDFSLSFFIDGAQGSCGCMFLPKGRHFLMRSRLIAGDFKGDDIGDSLYQYGVNLLAGNFDDILYVSLSGSGDYVMSPDIVEQYKIISCNNDSDNGVRSIRLPYSFDGKIWELSSKDNGSNYTFKGLDASVVTAPGVEFPSEVVTLLKSGRIPANYQEVGTGGTNATLAEMLGVSNTYAAIRAQVLKIIGSDSITYGRNSSADKNIRGRKVGGMEFDGDDNYISLSVAAQNYMFFSGRQGSNIQWATFRIDALGVDVFFFLDGTSYAACWILPSGRHFLINDLFSIMANEDTALPSTIIPFARALCSGAFDDFIETFDDFTEQRSLINLNRRKILLYNSEGLLVVLFDGEACEMSIDSVRNTYYFRPDWAYVTTRDEEEAYHIDELPSSNFINPSCIVSKGLYNGIAFPLNAYTYDEWKDWIWRQVDNYLSDKYKRTMNPRVLNTFGRIEQRINTSNEPEINTAELIILFAYVDDGKVVYELKEYSYANLNTFHI